MPKVATTILLLNLAIAGLQLLGLAVAQPPAQGTGPTPMLIVTSCTIGGLLLLEFVVLVRLRALYNFSRLLLFMLAVLQGLLLLYQLGRLFSAEGAMGVLFAAITVIYFIGVRGFLNSEAGREYFYPELARAKEFDLK